MAPITRSQSQNQAKVINETTTATTDNETTTTDIETTTKDDRKVRQKNDGSSTNTTQRKQVAPKSKTLCPLCLEPLLTGPRPFVVLAPCGHCLHQDCWGGLQAYSIMQDKLEGFQCINCRALVKSYSRPCLEELRVYGVEDDTTERLLRMSDDDLRKTLEEESMETLIRDCMWSSSSRLVEAALAELYPRCYEGQHDDTSEEFLRLGGHVAAIQAMEKYHFQEEVIGYAVAALFYSIYCFPRVFSELGNGIEVVESAIILHSKNTLVQLYAFSTLSALCPVEETGDDDTLNCRLVKATFTSLKASITCEDNLSGALKLMVEMIYNRRRQFISLTLAGVFPDAARVLTVVLRLISCKVAVSEEALTICDVLSALSVDDSFRGGVTEHGGIGALKDLIENTSDDEVRTGAQKLLSCLASESSGFADENEDTSNA